MRNTEINSILKWCFNSFSAFLNSSLIVAEHQKVIFGAIQHGFTSAFLTPKRSYGSVLRSRSLPVKRLERCIFNVMESLKELLFKSES
eukprot:UN09223